MTTRHLHVVKAERPKRAPHERPLIAVIIPCYNEEKNIERVLGDVAALAQAHADWKILPVVVNDGSSDNSEALLAAIGPKYGAHIINLPVNLGIGGAVQAGFRYAVGEGADVALQLDGDGQHPAAGIPAIVEPVLAGKTDVAVGSRYVKGAGGNVSSLMRHAGTMCFSTMLRVLAGVNIKDTTSGFRAFSYEASDFLARCYPDDYPEVQAYVPLARKGFRIVEYPVCMKPRRHGRSSITALRSVYYMVKVAFATAMDVIRRLPPRRKRLSGRFRDRAGGGHT